MFKLFALTALLWSSTSLAGVDDEFASGVFGMKWGVSLEEVQAAYPGGTAWESAFEGTTGAVYYAFPGNFKVLNIDAPVRLIHFVFTRKQRLQAAFFHFQYSERESALYGAAEVLGQNYSIRDAAGTRKYVWPSGKVSAARLNIGDAPQNPWVYLSIRYLP